MNNRIFMLTVLSCVMLSCGERGLNNIYDRQSRAYRVNVAPFIENITALDPLFTNTEIRIYAQVFDRNNDWLTKDWYFSGGFGKDTNGDTIIWHSPELPGTTMVELKVQDLFLKDSLKVYFILDTMPKNHAPVIVSAIANPTEMGFLDTAILKVWAYDEDPKDYLNFFWTADHGNFPDGANTDSVKWVAPAKAGFYSIKVRASDGELEDDFSTIAIVSGPPKIDSIKFVPSAPRVNDTVVVTVYASDEENDFLTYEWGTAYGSLVGLYQSGPSVQWKVPNESGRYGIGVSVFDQFNSVTDTFALFVNPPNSPPIITSITAQPKWIYTGETIRLNVTATDADNDPLTYDWTAPIGTFPGGANKTQVNWQAPTSLRRITIVHLSVKVSDGEDYAAAGIDVTVVPTNPESDQLL